MVGRGVSRCRRRHIANHDVGQATELGFDDGCDGRIVNIGAQDLGSGDRWGLRKVEADDDLSSVTYSDALDRDLGPAARRAAQIDDPAAAPQQPETIIQLDQLEGCTRPVAEPLRSGDIRVVQLTGEPLCRRRLAPARAVYPYCGSPGG